MAARRGHHGQEVAVTANQQVCPLRATQRPAHTIAEQLQHRALPKVQHQEADAATTKQLLRRLALFIQSDRMHECAGQDGAQRQPVSSHVRLGTASSVGAGKCYWTATNRPRGKRLTLINHKLEARHGNA